MTRPYFILALLAFVIGGTLLAAYFGACARLVAGDTGGKGEPLALLFGILFLIAGVFAWRKRSGPMT